MTNHTFYIAIDCIYIVGFTILAFALFERRRERVWWANIVFGITVAVGFAKGLVGLLWELGCFTVGRTGSYRLHLLFNVADGLLMGFLISLILSGQLTGTRQSPNTALEPTPTAP
jgi:hypothetical protein